jgi:ABC-type proline/glycine betaine transport system permease subunit
MPQQQHLLTYLIIIVALALVIFRNLRPQKLKISRLWLMPAVLLVLVGVSFWATALQLPPGALWISALAVLIGLAAGIPFGIVRGRHSKLRAGNQPGTIIVEQSAITLILFLVAFGARYLIRFFVPTAGPGTVALTDGFLAFAIASVIAARYVLYARFKLSAAGADPVGTKT